MFFEDGTAVVYGDTELIDVCCPGVVTYSDGEINIDGAIFNVTANGTMLTFDGLTLSLTSHNLMDACTMFCECINLERIDGMGDWDMSNVVRTSSMFEYCTSLKTLDLSGWKFFNATKNSYGFYFGVPYAAILDGNLCTAIFFENGLIQFANNGEVFNEIPAGELTYAQNSIMDDDAVVIEFYNNGTQCTIDGLELTVAKSNLRESSYMFYGCSSLTDLDISSMNTDLVWTEGMFGGMASLVEITLGDGFVFGEGCYLPSPYWYDVDTNVVYTDATIPSNVAATYRSDVEGYEYYLTSSENFNSVLPYDIQHVIFTDIAAPDVAELTDVSVGHDGTVVMWMDGATCYVSTQTDGVKIIAPENMQWMFGWRNDLISVDLSNLDTSNVTNMSEMFVDCFSLEEINFGDIDTNNVTDMNAMFNNCQSLISLDLSAFDTNNATDMSYMFSGCTSLVEIDLGDIETDSVTNMQGMFNNCTSLNNLDLSGFDTSNVVYMSGMFQDCLSLTTLDLSSFSTNNVADMSYMFYGCSMLESVYVFITWTTENVTSSYRMFYGCDNLVGGFGTSYDANNVDKTYAVIDGNAPGYFRLGKIMYRQPYDAMINGVKYSIVFSDYGDYDYVGCVTAYEDDWYFDDCELIVSGTIIDFWGTQIDLTSLSQDGTQFVVDGITFTAKINSDSEKHDIYFDEAYSVMWGSYSETYVFHQDGSGECYFDGVLDSSYPAGFFTYIDDNVIAAEDWWYDYSYATFDGTQIFNNTEIITLMSIYTDRAYCAIDSDGNEITYVFFKDGSVEYYVNKTLVEEFAPGTATYNGVTFTFNDTVIDPVIGIEFNFNGLTYELIGIQEPWYERLYSMIDSNGDKISYVFYDDGTVKRYINNLLAETMPSGSATYGLVEMMINGTLAEISFDGSQMTFNGNVYTREEENPPVYNAEYIAYVDGNKIHYEFGGNWVEYYVNDEMVNEWHPETIVLGDGIIIFGDTCAEAIDGGTSVIVDDVTYSLRPALAYGWYNGSLPMTEVQNVIILDSYTPDGTELESWNADIYDIGFYKGYLLDDGVTVILVGDGSGKIAVESSNMFSDFASLTSVEGLELLNLTITSGMFKNCASLQSIDMSNVDTSNIVNMNGMFSGCLSLTSLNLSGFNTSNVAYMYQMFYDCSSLTSLDLSSFDTSNVIDMSYMFRGCSNLTTIIVNDTWDTTNVTSSYNMFYGCDNLVGAIQYNSARTDKTHANYETGYLTRYNPIELIIDNQCSDQVSINMPSTIHGGGTRIELIPVGSDFRVVSFKLNDVAVSGDYFVAPEDGGTVVITDVILAAVFESDHNPYQNNQSQYYEASFEGATSLVITLTYQTESTNWDWVQLLNASGATISNKYGGTTKTTTTITVNGDYVKIWFKTDGSVNGYYGFHAVVTPVYD
jgi:surface protein